MKRRVREVSAWLVMVVAGAVVPASAQTRPAPPVEVWLGYEALHIPRQTYPVGVALGVSDALNDVVRIVGELGLSIAPETTSTYGSGGLKLSHYGVGPRVTASARRVLVYGQLLAGGVHTKADLTTATGAPFDEGDNAFMLEPAAGVMIPLTPRLAVDVEGAYRRVFWEEYGPENETRVFAGMRIAFR